MRQTRPRLRKRTTAMKPSSRAFRRRASALRTPRSLRA